MKTKEYYVNKAEELFDEGYACSQSVALAFAEDYDVDEKTLKLISSTFGGGMGRLREKCGAITGAFMIIGLAYGYENPGQNNKKQHAYSMVRDFNKKAEEMEGSTICLELLKKRAAENQASKVESQGHHQGSCRKMVADMAGLLYDTLQESGE